MTDTNKPSEAAIREAKQRVGYKDNAFYTPTLLAFAAMIEKHEPETLVDPAVLRAREICAEEEDEPFKDGFSSGRYDTSCCMTVVIRALREGMPK